MSVVGKLGCCCGGCGALGAHIYRTFAGWRQPLPGDFGEWLLTGSSTSEEIGDWVNRSAAYALEDVPWYYDPNNWAPGCTRFQPIRFLGIRVNALGTYADLTNPDAPEVVNFSYVYDRKLKKELWFQDESGRVGITTEEFYQAGSTNRIYAATRNETNGSLVHTGQYQDWNDVLAAHTPPRSTYSYDLMGALGNPLGGSARLTITHEEFNGLPAIKIVREIMDPVALSESQTLAAFSRQETLLYNPLTFAQFETWLNSLLDEVKLTNPDHLYAAGVLYNSDFNTWNAAPAKLHTNQSNDFRWEPFYTSKIGVWPNRVAINNHLSRLWDDARYMMVAAIRHTDVQQLQLFRRYVRSTTPECLLSYEYAGLPDDFTAGMDYTTACTVPTEVGLWMKTGDYVLECNAGGTQLYASADIAFANGILFVSRHAYGNTFWAGELDPVLVGCYRLGGDGLPPWNDGMPLPLGNDVFLEEASEIEACCFP